MSTFILLICIPIIGYTIAQLRSIVVKRTLVWGMTVCSVALADQMTLVQPAMFRMIAIIGVLLYAMKSVVYVEYLIRDKRKLPVPRLAAYHLWIGMRPYVFAKRKDRPYADTSKYIRLGIERLLVGLALVVLSRLLSHAAVQWDWNPTYGLVGASLLLLMGLSFIVHFGILNIWTGIWRSLGFDCQQLFRNPLMSRSLNEFWSRRWNLAFSEMTTLGVYRPLTGIVGKEWAIFLSFLFSGILHEVAISLPVRQGFGMPLLYFFIHGCGVVIELILEKRGLSVFRIPWLGRIWTMAWLILPAPLLFNPYFLKAVIWPIIGIS